MTPSLSMSTMLPMTLAEQSGIDIETALPVGISAQICLK